VRDGLDLKRESLTICAARFRTLEGERRMQFESGAITRASREPSGSAAGRF